MFGFAHGTARSSWPKRPVKPDAIPVRDQSLRREVKRRMALRITRNVILRISRDNLMLASAGVAFYAMTAIFPAIAAFVSVYALFSDPHVVQSEAAAYADILPGGAFNLLSDALNAFTLKSSATLNFALIFSLAIAIWGAKSAVSSLMTGLNIVNGTVEKRSFVALQGTALSLTVGSIAFAGFALSAIALLPAVINTLPVSEVVKTSLDLGRWPLLALVVGFALAVIYRFGPSRDAPKWKWIT